MMEWPSWSWEYKEKWSEDTCSATQTVNLEVMETMTPNSFIGFIYMFELNTTESETMNNGNLLRQVFLSRAAFIKEWSEKLKDL
ncbi:DNA mismatch repair protein MutS [Dirofilaria immitis]